MFVDVFCSLSSSLILENGTTKWPQIQVNLEFEKVLDPYFIASIYTNGTPYSIVSVIGRPFCL